MKHTLTALLSFLVGLHGCYGGGCLTAVDCSMNGECHRKHPADKQEPGKCQCLAGWTGSRCEELDLLPVSTEQIGLQMPNHASTWGGSVIQRNGTWHMFASQMVNGCGLNYWAMNSQVIRATSDNPLGPYTYQQVILPVFAHDANVMEAPTGEIVLLVTARKGVRPYNCNNVNTTTNNASPPPSFQNSTTPPKDSYMLWAPQPEGPWSEPVLVLNSTIWNADYWNVTGRVAHCDSNLNGIINDDGSFLGLWRKCETLNLLTIPHRLTATDWKNASTYQPHLQPLFVLAGSGAEDPTNIWTTTINGLTAYHAIFHDEQATRCMLGQCSANGRHAFSLDGKSWRYASRNAYSKSVEFWNPTNNSTETLSLDTRARPHVVLDRPTGSLLALSTGVEANKPEVSDYVYTLVQPLRRREKEEEDSIQPQHSSMTKSIVRG